MNSLPSKKRIRFFCFAETGKEERKVVVIIQLFDVDLPVYFVSFGIVVDCDGEIASVVEFTETWRKRMSMRCPLLKVINLAINGPYL